MSLLGESELRAIMHAYKHQDFYKGNLPRARTFFPLCNRGNMFSYLSALSIVDNELSLILDGAPCARSSFVDGEGQVKWRSVKALTQRAGCTIRYSNLQNIDTQVDNVCRILRDTLRARAVVAYLFISPANSSALPAHFDLSDLFILQLFGVKTWPLWAGPCKNVVSSDRVNNAALAMKIAESGPSKVNLTLKPLDFVFVPTPTVHMPKAGPKGSVHISWGIIRS